MFLRSKLPGTLALMFYASLIAFGQSPNMPIEPFNEKPGVWQALTPNAHPNKKDVFQFNTLITIDAFPETNIQQALATTGPYSKTLPQYCIMEPYSTDATAMGQPEIKLSQTPQQQSILTISRPKRNPVQQYYQEGGAQRNDTHYAPKHENIILGLWCHY